MSNLAYSINGDDVISRPLNDGELKKAREEALPKLNEGKWALRSCWNCNGSHSHFLEDTEDEFLFRCFDCGRIYYNGMDLTEDEE